MKQNDKYLTESIDILNREFGQPLPTIEDTTKAHQAKKLQENPAAVAAATAAMIQMKANNPKTGRVNKLSTALGNKSHPGHKKAKGIFARLVDKFKKNKGDKDFEKQKKKVAKGADAWVKKQKDDAQNRKQYAGESMKEGPDDIRFAKKALSQIVKTEQKFRKQMYDLEQTFLQDPNPTNRKLATEIKKSYKGNVTKFMRESVLMVKRMK